MCCILDLDFKIIYFKVKNPLLETSIKKWLIKQGWASTYLFKIVKTNVDQKGEALDMYVNIIVRIEFSPLVYIVVNNGHYWPMETTDKHQLESISEFNIYFLRLM